jgi:eukaryotic-like serine/threonine-protein kinase
LLAHAVKKTYSSRPDAPAWEIGMLGQLALGKYRLLRSLGSGSNGAVYLAEPIRYPNNRVVVKRIHDHAVERPKFRQLFDAEVRSMRNFNHPYSVRLLDAALDDPIGPCLVMEYVPGITLEDLLQRSKRISVERVGRLLGFLCHAMQAAHTCGIIHRDLKPANLMVLNAGQATETLKVMDFGFAGFMAKPHLQLAELTGHGPIFALGTPEYVSPEMVRGDPVDTRSDLYSVGVILYEMLSGRMPFDYPVMEDTLAAHIKVPPPRFHRIGAGDISPAVEGVVQLALSKFANERHQSARELAQEFGRVLGEKFWDDTAPKGWEPTANSGAYIPAHTPAPMAGLPEPAAPADPFLLKDAFEVAIPERLVAAKIRGFVEDVDATVLESEPGLIRLQVGVPSNYQNRPVTESSLINWFKGKLNPVQKGKEPIAVELHMEKPDPSLTRLRVSVTCGPVKEHPPRELGLWRERCGKVQTMLRQYLGA